MTKQTTKAIHTPEGKKYLKFLAYNFNKIICDTKHQMKMWSRSFITVDDFSWLINPILWARTEHIDKQTILDVHKELDLLEINGDKLLQMRYHPEFAKYNHERLIQFYNTNKPFYGYLLQAIAKKSKVTNFARYRSYLVNFIFKSYSQEFLTVDWEKLDELKLENRESEFRNYYDDKLDKVLSHFRLLDQLNYSTFYNKQVDALDKMLNSGQLETYNLNSETLKSIFTSKTLAKGMKGVVKEFVNKFIEDYYLFQDETRVYEDEAKLKNVGLWLANVNLEPLPKKIQSKLVAEQSKSEEGE